VALATQVTQNDIAAVHANSDLNFSKGLFVKFFELFLHPPGGLNRIHCIRFDVPTLVSNT
jgi:hypothetical protein